MNLSLLSRIAFLCNFCLLAALSMKYHSLVPRGEIQSTVIIAGLFLSFLANFAACVWVLIIISGGKKFQSVVPVWLAVINFLFLIFQLYLVLA